MAHPQLLLAGGGGTRLWPLSTPSRPKQFLPLVSSRSLLADTWDRVLPVADDIFVATSREHVDLVRKELPDLPAERILPEAARRNSGPAIVKAALSFQEDGDPVTAAVPSDHAVRDPEAFCRTLSTAAKACETASVVVLGVRPTRPDTDFGYLEVAGTEAPNGQEVVRFVEKPDALRAESLVRSGRHYWNAGIFVFRPSRFLAEARRVARELVVVASVRGEGDAFERWEERRLKDGSTWSVYKRVFTGDQLADELGGKVLFEGGWFIVARA